MFVWSPLETVLDQIEKDGTVDTDGKHIVFKEDMRYGVIYEQIVALQEQLAEVEASNKAVESALEGVDYRGSYADGVMYLKQQLADRMSPGMALALKATIRDLSEQLAAVKKVY